MYVVSGAWPSHVRVLIRKMLGESSVATKINTQLQYPDGAPLISIFSSPCNEDYSAFKYLQHFQYFPIFVQHFMSFLNSILFLYIW